MCCLGCNSWTWKKLKYHIKYRCFRLVRKQAFFLCLLARLALYSKFSCSRLISILTRNVNCKETRKYGKLFPAEAPAITMRKSFPVNNHRPADAFRIIPMSRRYHIFALSSASLEFVLTLLLIIGSYFL